MELKFIDLTKVGSMYAVTAKHSQTFLGIMRGYRNAWSFVQNVNVGRITESEYDDINHAMSVLSIGE